MPDNRYLTGGVMTPPYNKTVRQIPICISFFLSEYLRKELATI
jgi:hypothetical protein